VLNQVDAGRPRSLNAVATGAASPTISVDERSGTIIVTGSETHFKVIEQVLQTLDKVPEKGERDVQFVWLKKCARRGRRDQARRGFSPNGRRLIDLWSKPTWFANSVTLIGRRAGHRPGAGVDREARRDEARTPACRCGCGHRPAASRTDGAHAPEYLSANVDWKLKLVEKLQPTPVTNTNAAPATNTNATSATNVQAIAEVVIAVDKEANALILSGPGE
jgi:hypothetical protein